MSEIRRISKKDFTNKKLNVPGFVLVECYSNASGPLQIMEPILKKLRTKFQEHMMHCRINIAHDSFVVDNYFVQHVPSYLFFYHGDFIDRIDGLLPFSEFAIVIEKHMAAKFTKCSNSQYVTVFSGQVIEPI